MNSRSCQLTENCGAVASPRKSEPLLPCAVRFWHSEFPTPSQERLSELRPSLGLDGVDSSRNLREHQGALHPALCRLIRSLGMFSVLHGLLWFCLRCCRSIRDSVERAIKFVCLSTLNLLSHPSDSSDGGLPFPGRRRFAAVRARRIDPPGLKAHRIQPVRPRRRR